MPRPERRKRNGDLQVQQWRQNQSVQEQTEAQTAQKANIHPCGDADFLSTYLRILARASSRGRRTMQYVGSPINRPATSAQKQATAAGELIQASLLKRRNKEPVRSTKKADCQSREAEVGQRERGPRPTELAPFGHFNSAAKQNRRHDDSRQGGLECDGGSQQPAQPEAPGTEVGCSDPSAQPGENCQAVKRPSAPAPGFSQL